MLNDSDSGLLLQHLLELKNARMSLEEDYFYELNRPSTMYRPRVFKDGGFWFALLGRDIQEGVCGFGSTPEEAMAAFDKVWKEGK